MEEWRLIANTNNRYAVSSLGRIKSLGGRVPCGLGRERGYKEKILTPMQNNKGYLKIRLLGQNRLVHRLVAEAFIDNPNVYPIVNHKDENRQNNTVENLEWCNYKYNSNYGHCKEKLSKLQNLRKKKVIQIDLDGGRTEWESLRQIERELGFNHSNISNCCKGLTRTAYGFKWCYTNNDIVI